MKIFTEQQRFNQWWLYIVIGVSALAMIIPIVLNFDEILNNKAARISLSLTLLLIVVAVFIIRMITLHTRIDEKGIHYRFTPFHRKLYLIAWSDISNVYVRKYNAITEYGGWGYKGNNFRSRGKAFNVRGNIGIQIVFTNGKKLLIGTQKQLEVERVINTYKSKFINQ